MEVADAEFSQWGFFLRGGGEEGGSTCLGVSEKKCFQLKTWEKVEVSRGQGITPSPRGL